MPAAAEARAGRARAAAAARRPPASAGLPTGGLAGLRRAEPAAPFVVAAAACPAEIPPLQPLALGSCHRPQRARLLPVPLLPETVCLPFLVPLRPAALGHAAAWQLQPPQQTQHVTGRLVAARAAGGQVVLQRVAASTAAAEEPAAGQPRLPPAAQRPTAAQQTRPGRGSARGPAPTPPAAGGQGMQGLRGP